MHSSTSFLLLAVLATLALAAPVTSSHGLLKRSFRVEHKGRPKLSGRETLAHVHRKYGWSSTVWDSSSPGEQPSANSTNPSSGSEQGEVQATPEENESAYISPVNIGGQTLNLDFDTGSSDLWVFSTELPASQGQGHTLFDPSKSSSFVQYQGASWHTQYGDGSSAEGNVGFDTVSIGGAIVQKQCVELAEQTLGFQSLTSSDGLLGLGFSSINTVQPQQQKTFWENIIDELAQPVFTADLDETASGSYEFGKIDSSKFTGDIQYTPVDSSNGYWQVDSKSNTIGGNQRQCTTCKPAVIDTGTSLLMVDADVAQGYYSQVQGAALTTDGIYAYPCSATLPDFGVAIGNGYTATLKGSDLTYIQQGNSCMGGVQPTPAGTPYQIYGDVFFKQFFVVFDGGNTQLGVAPKVSSQT